MITGLDEIEREITSTTTPYAQLFRSLLEKEWNTSYQLDARENCTDEDTSQLLFSRDRWLFVGIESIDLDWLRDVLLHDRNYIPKAWTLSFAFNWDCGPQVSAGNAENQLISNIADKSYTARGYIPGIVTWILVRWCESAGGLKKFPHTMDTIPLLCSVLPAGYHFWLRHSSQSKSIRTLLTGKMVWIVWPPTQQNLYLLEPWYAADTTDLNEDRAWEAMATVACNLRNGEAFVQRPGEAFTAPPFSPIMGLALETSVIARHDVTTYDTFLSSLDKIPLFEAWAKGQKESDTERYRIGYACYIIKCFGQILAGKYDDALSLERLEYPLKKPSAILEALKKWHGIRSNVFRLLTGDRQMNLLLHLWTGLLDMKSLPGACFVGTGSGDVRARLCWGIF
jgi:hypothetical protein